ncbi:unnamed protein product [Phytophthora lilii]|uniref:Unnamed protein product n=1 Tax=Phytophthora lilii TaxID=2077276 RepID=A0A9W7DCM5_9STRA|nr:unnamed protein product [Phytophthora lilii]
MVETRRTSRRLQAKAAASAASPAPSPASSPAAAGRKSRRTPSPRGRKKAPASDESPQEIPVPTDEEEQEQAKNEKEQKEKEVEKKEKEVVVIDSDTESEKTQQVQEQAEEKTEAASEQPASVEEAAPVEEAPEEEEEEEEEEAEEIMLLDDDDEEEEEEEEEKEENKEEEDDEDIDHYPSAPTAVAKTADATKPSATTLLKRRLVPNQLDSGASKYQEFFNFDGSKRETAATLRTDARAAEEAKVVAAGQKAMAHSQRQRTESQHKKSAGRRWFNFESEEMTDDARRDFALLRMRNYLDPKKFYKSSDHSRALPKHFQMGTVIEGSHEFHSARLTKKQRRKTFTDEIMADEAVVQYTHRVAGNLQAARMSQGPAASFQDLQAPDQAASAMVALSESMKVQAQWSALKQIWANPDRRRWIVRLLFGGATGALTLTILHETFKGMCRTPWKAVRLVARLVAVVGATIFGFVARGCKPKFKNWTLRFDILRAVIRECIRGARGERMVIDAKHARVIRSQSAAFGTVLGWFACRQYGRRLEPVHANELEHVWLRSAAPRTSTTKHFVVLYVHGGGFAVMSPRFYIAFGATLADAIEKELRQKLDMSEDVQVDVFLGNYRKAPEHCFPTPPEDTVAAYKHLLHTEGIPPEQIILAGDSAGGGLVMSTLLRMRDASKEHLPLAAILICPAVDMSEIETHGDSEEASAHCLLSPEMIAAGRLSYHTTASDPETWADASSVHCDLRGLPPVFVQAGSLDYIYQHSVRLAQKAEADGVTNWELDVHEGLPHVFTIFPSYVLPYAQIGVKRVAAFAAKHFAEALSGDRDAGILDASAA